MSVRAAELDVDDVDVRVDNVEPLRADDVEALTVLVAQTVGVNDAAAVTLSSAE